MQLLGKLPCLAFASVFSLCAISASVAQAQFSRTPTNLPSFQGNTGQSNSTMSSTDVQKLYLLRYLQGRSGGGVKRGAPQFIPFGNQMFMGGGMMPMQGQGQMQNAFPANAAAPAADSGKKSVEERKAEAQAAREERKRKAQERAEKRKQEAAARRAAAN